LTANTINMLPLFVVRCYRYLVAVLCSQLVARYFTS